MRTAHVGADIPTPDAIARRPFAVNAGSATVDVLDLRDPYEPGKVASIDVVADPAPPAAQNLRPEHVTTDGETAWVTLQEHNAIAVIDLRSARVRKVFALGFGDRSNAGEALDPSDDEEDAIAIRRWPAFGMYPPDAIANFRHGDKDYLITVNRGDARGADLGRQAATAAQCNTGGEGDFYRLFVPHRCSFSIWNARNGALVFDSNSQLGQLLASLLSHEFDASHKTIDPFDIESDKEGLEPECVTLSHLRGALHAFIGLECIRGVLVLDLSDPENPEFVDYYKSRNFRDLAGAAVASYARCEAVPDGTRPACGLAPRWRGHK